MNDTRWHRVQGGITREDRDGESWTIFRVGAQAHEGGLTYQMRVDIQTERLNKVEGSYKRVLDYIVRDLEIRIMHL